MARKKSAAAKARAAANTIEHNPGGGASIDRGKRNAAPLTSASHTLQLLITLSIQPILLLVSCVLLPQGITRSGAATDTSLASLAQGVKRLLAGELGDVRGKMGLALQGTALVQVWFAMRIWSWYKGAKALEEGDADAFKKAQAVGFWDQLEHVTGTLMSIPVAILAVHILLVVGGAPILSVPLSTITLSTYLALLALLPALNLYGSPISLGSQQDKSAPSQPDSPTWWITTFSRGSPPTPRDAIALFQLSGTILGAWLGAAGMALDWGRPWQIYPVPNMLAALGGLSIGNVGAALYCLLA